jgi:hypothetical protein
MLDNAEFSYNNLTHVITKMSLFFTLYNYHLNTKHFIKKEVLKDDILIAREREKEMIKMRKTLDK